MMTTKVKSKKKPKVKEADATPPAPPSKKGPPAKGAPPAPKKKPAAAASAEAGDDGSDDSSGDAALIKKMLTDTFGDDMGKSDEANKMALDMHQKALSAGEPADEAMNCAKYGMKAAKHNSEAEEAEEGDDDGSDTDDKNTDQEDPNADSDDDSDESAEAEEAEEVDESEEAAIPAAESATKKGGSLKEANTKLVAENATLKQKIAKQALESHVTKLCNESTLTEGSVKAFKALVKNEKTVEAIDATFKIFADAVKGASDAGAISFGEDKNELFSEGATALSEGKFDFSGCKE